MGQKQNQLKLGKTTEKLTGSRFDFKDAIFNGEDGDIEGTAAQVENKHVAFHTHFLVQTVCDGGGSRLVDDTEHVHA